MKAKNPQSEKLKIAVTSTALFNLEDSDRIYNNQPLEKYIAYQIRNEKNIPLPGSVFNLVKKLLALKHPKTKEKLVDVLLISKNNPNSGLRVHNAIENYGLEIERSIFTGGEPHSEQISASKADLFLSKNMEDVQEVLKKSIPAARILPEAKVHGETDQIRIAFDGDAVIFSDEAERVYMRKGLEAFRKYERMKKGIPLGTGPFYGFLKKIHEIQKIFQSKDNPIRTALFTARDLKVYRRAVITLRRWGIDLNEAYFMGGLDKTHMLSVFKPDIFFEDQEKYCLPASKIVSVGHVPSGVRNR